MCRPDDYPPFSDAEIAALVATDEIDPCPGCGKDLEDPHAQHDYGCRVAAEAYWTDLAVQR